MFKWLTDFISAQPVITAAVIALIGVALSAFVAFTASRRSVYISSVTAERSKWIDKLRANIANLLGVCSHIHSVRGFEKKDALPEDRQKADRLIALISLQLNPTDDSGIDRNLIIHLQKIVKSAEKGADYRTEENVFIRHCQFLLKEEWEKVKSEALGTIKYYLSLRFLKAYRRKKKYKDFVAGELRHLF